MPRSFSFFVLRIVICKDFNEIVFNFIGKTDESKVGEVAILLRV